MPLDLSPVHGHNQHRNAGIARRAATFPAGTSGGGMCPVILGRWNAQHYHTYSRIIGNAFLGAYEVGPLSQGGDQLKLYSLGFQVR